MAEGDDGGLRVELKTLRARVEEQTALQKRVADAVRRLGDALVSRKRRYETVLSLNSFAAYAIFTILLGGGFYYLYQSRVDELAGAEREAIEERNALSERAERLEAELERRRAGAERALELLELGRAGEPAAFVSAYADLGDDIHLTPAERDVLAEKAREARRAIGDERAEEGIEHFEEGRYEEATETLGRALELEDPGAESAALYYYEGRAQLELGAHAEAARSLELSLAAGAEDQGLADARFFLGEALGGLGDVERAANAFETYAVRSPTSPRAFEAEERARELSGE